MVDLPLVIVSALAIFVAALVQGLTGFGFVMLAAPIMTAFIEPRVVVPVMMMETVVLNVAILIHARRWLNIRRVWVLLLSGASATPLGAYLLVALDPAVLRVAIGVVVGATALMMLAGHSRTFVREKLASVPVGAASGLLNSSTGLAGPPVVLFFANQGVDPREFRANIVAHFTVLNIVTLPVFVVSGVFTRDTVLFGLAVLPAAVVGVAAGIALARWVSPALFLRLALVLVIFAGAGSIAAGLVL